MRLGPEIDTVPGGRPPMLITIRAPRDGVGRVRQGGSDSAHAWHARSERSTTLLNAIDMIGSVLPLYSYR